MLNSNNNAAKILLVFPVSGLLVFIAVSVWFVVYKVNISSDMQQFLPKKQHDSQVDNFVNTLDPLTILNTINESNSGLFLIAIKGGSASDRAMASIQLRKKLLADNNFIFVNNGKGRLPLKDRQLLTKYRYLLTAKNDQAAAFTFQSFSAELEQRYQELRSPMAGRIKKTLPEDPTAEVRYILQQWHSGKSPNKKQGVWASPDGTTALLVAAVAMDGADINKQQWAMDKIIQTFENNGIAGLDIQLSGMGVFAVQARQKIKSDARRISLVATVAVLLLILWAFRSLWYVLLAGLPLFAAILSGIVVTQLVFKSVHGITLAFGLTLIGVALDYPVHIFSHITTSESIRVSIKNIWPTLRLGVLTTCLGFFALTQTSFSGLAQLGVFAMSGLLVAALITRFVIPPLLLLQGHKTVVGVPGWVRLLSQSGIAVNVRVIAGSLVLLVFLFLAFPVTWESDLAKLSPVSAEQLSIDKQLRQQLNTDDLVNIAVVSASSSNEAIVKTEQLKNFLHRLIDKKIISGFRAPYQLLPSIETQLKRQQNLPTMDNLQSVVANATRNSPFKKNSFAAFIKDVEASRKLAPLTLVQLNDTLLGRQLAPMLFQVNNRWLGVIRFIGVSDSMQLEKSIRQLGRTDVSFLNLKTASELIIDRFREEAINLIGIGLMVIFITLLVSLKDKQRLMQVCFIVSMAVACDILLLNIFAQTLSLFHLVSLLLVLGLGLDYSLFFTRRGDDSAIRERTVYGILVCFGSTALVFAMLASSSIPVLSAIGLTVFMGVSLSFLFSILFGRYRVKEMF